MTCIVLLLLLSCVCVCCVFINCWYGYMLFNIHSDRIDSVNDSNSRSKNFNTGDDGDDDDDDVWKLRLGSVEQDDTSFVGRPVDVRNCESVLLVYYFFLFTSSSKSSFVCICFLLLRYERQMWMAMTNFLSFVLFLKTFSLFLLRYFFFVAISLENGLFGIIFEKKAHLKNKILFQN